MKQTTCKTDQCYSELTLVLMGWFDSLALPENPLKRLFGVLLLLLALRIIFTKQVGDAGYKNK